MGLSPSLGYMVSSLLLDPSPQPQCSAVEGYILQRVQVKATSHVVCTVKAMLCTEYIMKLKEHRDGRRR